ncbi:putative Polycomb group protein ASXL1 isoform X2 [Erpetoichthys calabaricus]|uniref:putative Polycomb group protein ASXL1 isoform X2 n=1 Tax=Erpetoichthys calabaricus TaxID=27687 RepID=UPI0022341D30|nr:putative Polycomb group protein ASXL1 isoform X2 [Erpetoichthys calabaricus]
MKDKQKRKKERTWAEAARMVLENFSDAPMTPKQILHVIETKGLKEMSGTSPLACLNTMLHSQCRGEDGIFFKLPGRLSLFTLKKNAPLWSKNLAAPEVSLDETSSSASCSTISQNKQAPPSRQSTHRATQQSGKQRKKGVMMPRVVLTPLKVNGEHVSSGFSGKHREAESNSKCSSNPSMTCSNSLRSRPEFGRKPGQQFKSLHKSRTGPLKRRRGEEVDFETPGSILVNTNIRALINTRTFAALPSHFQQQLLLLLPEVDRQVCVDGMSRLSSSALNNEFFTHASQCWKERLADGEFTHEMQVRIRQEMEKEKKVELWKEKFFEDYYGQKSGLSKEESLQQTLQKEDAENGPGVGTQVRRSRPRNGGRRRKDGRLRRRSRTDLRSRVRRSLCAKPKNEKKINLCDTIAVSGATSCSPRECKQELREDKSIEQGSEHVPEIAVTVNNSDSSLRQHPGDASSECEKLGENEVLADHLRNISAVVCNENSAGEGEMKDQKRKCAEPMASTSFPEKKPRLDDRQSFRNTIDCVRSEKPQPTKEEPKVPPIRIQLSRIKQPWVVKGPPTYQICHRIIPNHETGRTGARTLADIKAHAQQARAQREAAAAVAAIGGGGGPGGGPEGGGDGGGGRGGEKKGGGSSHEPETTGGFTDCIPSHLTGTQLLQASMTCIEEDLEPNKANNASENGKGEAILRSLYDGSSSPKTTDQLTDSTDFTDNACINHGGSSLHNFVDSFGEKQTSAERSEVNSESALQSSPFIGSCLENTKYQNNSTVISAIKAKGVTCLAPTSIPDTLPRFGAKGIDALRLVSFQPLQKSYNRHTILTQKKDEPLTKEENVFLKVDNCEDDNIVSAEISLETTVNEKETQAELLEHVIPGGGKAHKNKTGKYSSCSDEDTVLLEKKQGNSHVATFVQEEVLHTDSTDTASDFENESCDNWSWNGCIEKDGPFCQDAEETCANQLKSGMEINLINGTVAASLPSNGKSQSGYEAKENSSYDSHETAQLHAESLTALQNTINSRKSGHTMRQVSSVEANNPLVTQLLQGNLPLEKVLPQPHSKLEISPLSVPRQDCNFKRDLSTPAEGTTHQPSKASVESNGKETDSNVRVVIPPATVQIPATRKDSWPESKNTSDEKSLASNYNKQETQVKGLEQKRPPCFEEVNKDLPVQTPSQGIFTQQTNSVRKTTNPPKFHPSDANSDLIADNPTFQSQNSSSQEHAARALQTDDKNNLDCRNSVVDPDQAVQRQVSKHKNLAFVDVSSVKLDWLSQKIQPGAQHEKSLSSDVLSKTNSVTSKKEVQQNCDPKEDFSGRLLNMGMSLTKFSRESLKPYQDCMESYIPFQFNIQQQFYGKFPRLQFNSNSGLNYMTNMSISDSAFSGFSKNIANSVMQLRQKSGFAGRHHASISIQTFAENSVEEMALKCSCRLKAMIMCKGCGAFCHDDCIGPSKLCVSCLVVR